jgi:signal transduction histidine kinase
MRRRALALAGVIVGVAAESVAFDWGRPRLWVPDVAVGWVFIGCGLTGRARRPESATGFLMVATGFTWFLGNFASVGLAPVAWVAAHAVYLHRGPLVHCVLSFPTGRMSSRLQRAMVALGYATAAFTPLGRTEGVVVAVGALLVVSAVGGSRGARGLRRLSRLVRTRAAVTVGIVLVGGAVARLAFPSGDANLAVLLAYEAALCAVGVDLLLGLLGARREREAMTDLVVELAEDRSETLRDALARTLGDPTMEVGFWLPESDGYVDARGRPVALPPPGHWRTVTPIEADGRRLGVLVHDPAVLADPELLESVAAAAGLAASNARLQAEVRAQVSEVQASRRRLLQAADEERRGLERRLREGAGRRLDALKGAMAAIRRRQPRSAGDDPGADHIEQADVQLRRTIEDVYELARGLHPRVLEESGLAGALADLARRSPVPVSVRAPSIPLPRTVEAGVYFVCSEGLANVAKYAHASSATLTVEVRADRLFVEVTDDGVGGADPGAGSGLRGLADRIEALGGRLAVASPNGAGTHLTAEIPLGGEVR